MIPVLAYGETGDLSFSHLLLDALSVAALIVWVVVIMAGVTYGGMLLGALRQNRHPSGTAAEERPRRGPG
jgi:hypothetical protein